MAAQTFLPTKRIWLASACAGLAVVLGAGFIGCGRPPQMGADQEVFQAVDALFTAITARDEALLSLCEQRLHALRGAGELPADASTYLDKIIRKARAGDWEPAAEKLYIFMQAQRREGTRDRRPTKQTPRMRRTMAAACAAIVGLAPKRERDA